MQAAVPSVTGIENFRGFYFSSARPVLFDRRLVLQLVPLPDTSLAAVGFGDTSLPSPPAVPLSVLRARGLWRRWEK